MIDFAILQGSARGIHLKRREMLPRGQVNIVPNVITAFGLACGLFVIFKAVMVGAQVDLFDLMHWSIILIVFAVFADFLDGAVARAIKAESEFGFMFDSLADAVTFGVAPSVIFLKSITSFEREGEFVFFSIICAMTFSMCGVLRLVRFNVEGLSGKKAKVEEFSLKKSFTGLPIPAAAISAISLIYFLVSPFSSPYFQMGFKPFTLVVGSSMILLGYLMICRLRFPSLKSLHIRIPTFPVIFLTAVGVIFVLYGILYYLPVVCLLASLLYLFFGISLSIYRSIKGRRLGR